MIIHSKNNLKGQVLLFSLLLLSSAVVMSFSLSTIFIRDIRLSNDAVASLKAFYLADRASEENLYNYIKAGGACQEPLPFSAGEYETVTCDDKQIITEGHSGSTSRSIEIDFE
ncbi:MAG TPA: hypothetical protein PLX10_01285 [Candidatus Paceibacterota bacterium]|nr:hypothetical protein [Candidatus Paceibacterota bacterium]